MLSAYIARLLGLGRPMTKEKLAQVNLICSSQNYVVDEEAAKDVQQSIKKLALKESTFAKYFLIGVQNEDFRNSS
jgi:proteasome assembly chaperone (PAC2) family protein